jgi:hypothetical protein
LDDGAPFDIIIIIIVSILFTIRIVYLLIHLDSISSTEFNTMRIRALTVGVTLLKSDLLVQFHTTTSNDNTGSSTNTLKAKIQQVKQQLDAIGSSLESHGYE